MLFIHPLKESPAEKTMLELIKEFEQKAREVCEMSIAIALKYQKRTQEIRAGQ